METLASKLAETMEDYSADECRKVVSKAFQFAIAAMKESNHFTKVNFLKSLRTYYVACKDTHPNILRQSALKLIWRQPHLLVCLERDKREGQIPYPKLIQFKPSKIDFSGTFLYQ